MNRGVQLLMVLAVLGAVAAGVVLWRGSADPPPPPEAAPTTPEAQAPASAAGEPAASSEPAIKHPVEVEASLPPPSAQDVGPALADLLGRKSVMSFLQVDEFPRRFAATVDNLGRSHAPAALWPVNPTAGRFTVEELDSGPVIAADNAARYTQFVLLAETVDVGRAVDLYVRLYPLLQRAYQELGYPTRYFNDRLIEVIDLLLATPDAEYPVKLQLVEVKGPIPSMRPWVRYEYADPALESLSSGQKILLRVGAVNARRLKAKLAEIRQEILKRAVKR